MEKMTLAPEQAYNPNEVLTEFRGIMQQIADEVRQHNALSEEERENYSTVADFVDLLADLHRDAADLMDGLDDWLTAGGELPSDWEASRKV